MWARYLREDLADHASAAEFYQYAADSGHARSTYKLAVMHLLGRGVQCSNPKMAKALFSRLIKAKCNHICVTYFSCMAALAVPSQMTHHQVERMNLAKNAIRRMLKSVELGLQYHMESPWTEVLLIDEEQIKSCMAQAMLTLGRNYMRGSFVGQNVDLSLKWLIASARLKNADAMCMIGGKTPRLLACFFFVWGGGGISAFRCSLLTSMIRTVTII